MTSLAPAPDGRPLPRRTPDSAAFWAACAEHRLVLQRCEACAVVRYPPMPGCFVCGSPRFTNEVIEPRGMVIRSTIVHHSLDPSFAVPYAVVVVELDCGTRLISRLVNAEPSAACHGLRVRGVWEDAPAAKTALLLFEPDADGDKP